MKPGEFSEPLQSGGGFQIVKLNDMRGAERTMVDQLHARHILLRPNEILDDAAARQKLLGIREQIVGGDDFATVAEAVSEDTGVRRRRRRSGLVVARRHGAGVRADAGDAADQRAQRADQDALRLAPLEVLDRRSHDTTDEVKRTQCARADPREQGRRRARAVGAPAARPGVRRHPPLKPAAGDAPASARSARSASRDPASPPDRRELRRAGRHRPGHLAGARGAAVRARLAVLGDLELLETRARLLGSRVELRACRDAQRRRPRTRSAACRCCRSPHPPAPSPASSTRATRHTCSRC